VARIGFLCLPYFGHFNPLSALAHELGRRGHEVAFLASPDSEDAVVRRGFEYIALDSPESPRGTFSEQHSLLRRLAGMEAALTSVRFSLVHARAVLSVAPQILRESRFDFLVVDQADLASSAVASALEFPFASAALCLMMNHEPGLPAWACEPAGSDGQESLRNQRQRSVARYFGRPLFSAINAFRASLGEVPISDVAELWSKLAEITQQPAGFEFPRRHLPAWFHFTGPFHRAEARPHVSFPFDRLTAKPLVYAAFGSMVNQQMGLFRAIAAACANLGAQLVISLGGGGTPQEIPPLPGDPMVVAFAPQLEILRRAQLMITHAGLNSTLECLAAGVPMVAIPITNDEPAVAARIAWTGAGLVVPMSDCGDGRVQRAIGEVLRNPSYRGSARRMQQEIAEVNGLERAADIVEEALRTRRPVLRAAMRACHG
jgi:MGT family glycosyltransferase